MKKCTKYLKNKMRYLKSFKYQTNLLQKRRIIFTDKKADESFRNREQKIEKANKNLSERQTYATFAAESKKIISFT